MKFLEQTAKYLYDKFGDGISEVCIVLPNRRGGLYLRKYIGRLAGKTTWAPEIYAVEDFILRLSGLALCDNVRSLFELYEVHRAMEGEKAQPFNDFMGWGQQLINDFNEADSYLVDTEKLFGYLTESKSIAVWNPAGNALTDFEKNYLAFFGSLHKYHELFVKRLLQARLGYPGLIFRTAAENIEKSKGSLPWKYVVFAGMNAMTAAEERITEVLVDAGKAEMLWDSDEYYLENPMQEAGDFLRRWKKKWHGRKFLWNGTSFKAGEKNISITGVPFHVGQVKHCSSIIEKCLRDKIPPEEIAVVLMDEHLLIPLLNSLPGNLPALNITMGYPLKLSPLYSFLESIFRMHENAEKFSASRTGADSAYYFRDVFNVIRHPLVRWITMGLSKGNQFVLDDLVFSLRNSGRIFIGKKDIAASVDTLFAGATDFLQEIFMPWKDAGDAIACLIKVLGFLKDVLIESSSVKGAGVNEHRIDLEFVYAFSLVLNRVENILGEYGSVKDARNFHGLLTRIAETETLPFYGEPLKGIQIMGMLESRTLDFRTVILLSANEDLLPSSKTSSSFIPFDIRRTFRLPTYHHRNAVYGYHFYRMIQRAEDIHIFYNTEPDELGGGEMSRFIKQVSVELPAYNPAITYRETLLSSPPLPRPAPVKISVPKTGEVLKLLMDKAQKGLGPTQMNHFRQCPLLFYFRDIAGLEEPEDLDETLDPRTMGQAVHGALQTLYETYIDRNVDTEAVKEMIKRSDEAVDHAFSGLVKGRDLKYGKNLLLLTVAKIMVRKYLESEMIRSEQLAGEGIALTIKHLEVPLIVHLPLNINGNTMDIVVRGFADRIDKEGYRWVIIDYKTGKADPGELRVQQWEDLMNDPLLDKSFQLLTYSWLVNKKYRKGRETIMPGILSLRKIGDGLMTITVPRQSGENGEVSEDEMNEFENILRKILTELFDPEKPFDQTDDSDRCKGCSFATLCGF